MPSTPPIQLGTDRPRGSSSRRATARPSRIWNAIGAASLGSIAGVGVGAWRHHELFGTDSVDPALWVQAVAIFALLCAFGGTITALGTALALRRTDPRRPSLLVLLTGGVLSGVLGCLVPGMVGVAAFGSLNTPYGGTGNMVFALFLGFAVFLSLWAPALDETKRLGWTRRIGIAAVASVIATTTVGLVGASVVTALGWIPSFPQLAEIAQQIGLWRLGACAGVASGLAVGAIVGFSCWLYLVAARTLSQRAA